MVEKIYDLFERIGKKNWKKEKKKTKIGKEVIKI